MRLWSSIVAWLPQMSRFGLSYILWHFWSHLAVKWCRFGIKCWKKLATLPLDQDGGGEISCSRSSGRKCLRWERMCLLSCDQDLLSFIDIFCRMYVGNRTAKIESFTSFCAYHSHHLCSHHLSLPQFFTSQFKEQYWWHFCSYYTLMICHQLVDPMTMIYGVIHSIVALQQDF